MSATFDGAAHGHAFRAAELAYDLGVAQGTPRPSSPPTSPTTNAEPVLDALPARVPVNMAQALRRARATTTLSQKRLAEQVRPRPVVPVHGQKEASACRRSRRSSSSPEALNMNLSTLITLGKDRLRRETPQSNSICSLQSATTTAMSPPRSETGTPVRAVGAQPRKLPDAFGRDADGDIERIEHDGAMLPWTLVFSFWIRARWNEWATELRFTRGEYRHEAALLAATPPPSSMRGSSGTLRGSVRYTKRPRPTQERHDDPIDYGPSPDPSSRMDRCVPGIASLVYRPRETIRPGLGLASPRERDSVDP